MTKRYVVAGWKIDKIAELLTESKRKHITDFKKEMQNISEVVFLKYIPIDVVSVWKKYPNRFYKCNSFVLHTDSKRSWDSRVYINLNIPTYDLSTDIILGQNPRLVKDLLILNKKLKVVEAEEIKLKNRIKCTLSSLKTYSKFKNEFPEAYKLLIEVIDEDVVEKKESKPLCDDVEKLRAELSQKTSLKSLSKM